jgi:hypothetical protein
LTKGNLSLLLCFLKNQAAISFFLFPWRPSLELNLSGLNRVTLGNKSCSFFSV